MDSFELTKIAGGVLAALLLIFAPKAAIDIALQAHKGPVVGGFTLPEATEAAAPADGGGEAEAAPPAAFDPAQVIAALPTANPDNAQTTFKKCLGCHTAEKDAASKAGPNLWGIVGRAHAAATDFKGYSEVLKSKGGTWTYDDLASFLHAPKSWLPGTRMIFPGVSDPAELADLIALLRTLSDSPPPLPEAAQPAPETPQPAPQ